MKTFKYLGKEISSFGLFGLGKSNLSVYKLLIGKYPKLSVTHRSDKAPDTPIAADKLFIEERALSEIVEDILFLSPSVRRDAAPIREAKARGVILSSDTELFFELNSSPVIGITGSDGKSTTSYLIASILRESGFDACLGGNFGIPLTSFVDLPRDITVAELSSFQLMYIAPKLLRAVITNITPNHLNWHLGLDEYIGAKANILKRANGAVIDADSPLTISLCKDISPFAVTSDSMDDAALRLTVKAENYITREKDYILLNGKKYLSIERALRAEAHNVKNYMLAIGATLGICDPDAARRAIESFRGLPHRSETVRTVGNIRYVNSSIDSSPERTLSTLRSLELPLSVIIGGRGKGLSLDNLAKELPTLASRAVLMGEVGGQLSELLRELHPDFPIMLASDMEEAVRLAEDGLSGCGTVVLSPAATSFDSYKNFEERGDHFKRIVLDK